MVEDEHGVWT
jgi:hypothetical protein